MFNSLSRTFIFAAAVCSCAAAGAFAYEAHAGNFPPRLPAADATAASALITIAAKRKSPALRLGLKGGGAARGGAGCHGAINCADLSKTLIKNGNTCKSWTCNNDSGKLSCWCDL